MLPCDEAVCVTTGATKFWFHVARVPNEVSMVMPCNTALMIALVTDAPIQFVKQFCLMSKQHFLLHWMN